MLAANLLYTIEIILAALYLNHLRHLRVMRFIINIFQLIEFFDMLPLTL